MFLRFTNNLFVLPGNLLVFSEYLSKRLEAQQIKIKVLIDLVKMNYSVWPVKLLGLCFV